MQVFYRNNFPSEGEEVVDLITIIVPVYNVEKYIKECINSLINQTYKNIEIILVDDGSKDNSGKICDDYATLDHRIKVIHKKNEGLGYARNSGLKVAQGKFVTFVDSDDKAENDLVENLIEGINESNCDTCIGGYKRISEKGIVNFVERYTDEEFNGKDVYNKLFTRMLGSAPEKHDAIRMSVWNVLYSMEIIRNYNIIFPSERKLISEDIIWDSEYYKHAKHVRVINSTAYNYRITPGSLTQKYKPDMLKKICVLYNEMNSRLSGDENKVSRLQRQFFVNLRACINQEKFRISNKEIKKAIRTIVDDETVHSVAVQYANIIKQRKQKLFVKIIEHKRVLIIYILLKIGRI